MRYLVTGLLLGMLMLGGTGFAQETGKPFVTIGTGGITGVYYAAGHAIAKVFDRTAGEQPFRIDAQASQGSVENINQVLDGTRQFGIAQGDMLFKAQKGAGPWDGAPQNKLRAVAALYPEALTIVAAADTGIDTVQDLRGKKISIGAPGSADEENVRNILKLHGLNPETDLTANSWPAIEATEQLQKGFIDAYFYTVGHPNLSLREATFGSRQTKLINIDQQIAANAMSKAPFLIRTDIPIEFYPALENKSPVPAIGVKAILFTSAQTPDSQVTAILQALLDDFGRFQRQHPAFAKISKADLVKGVMIPLHTAAENIYRKEGLK